MRDTSAIWTAPRVVARAPGVSVTRWQWSWPPQTGLGALRQTPPAGRGTRLLIGPPERSDPLYPPYISLWPAWLQAAGPGKHPWSRGGQGHRAGPGPLCQHGHPAHQDTHSPKTLSCRLWGLTEELCPQPDLKPARSAGTALGVGDGAGAAGLPVRPLHFVPLHFNASQQREARSCLLTLPLVTSRCLSSGWLWNRFYTEFIPTKVTSGAMVSQNPRAHDLLLS